MIYAIDFDGYLCQDAWPEIGEPKFDTINHFRELREQGHKLILWTCREGEKLQEAVEYVIAYITMSKIKPIQGFAEITITCYEKDLRRDADNVQSGANKVILDALQKFGIIENDSRRYIKLITPPVELDRENPRIEVILEGK